jgi:hypothetical protein
MKTEVWFTLLLITLFYPAIGLSLFAIAFAIIGWTLLSAMD